MEDLSAELKFPVPGNLSDEFELKIKTNLPEILVNGEDDLQNKIKSTLSLRYGIAIDDAMKLEIENSYNLRTTTHETFIRLIMNELTAIAAFVVWVVMTSALLPKKPGFWL